MATTASIRWTCNGPGFWTSKDGRFDISPLFMGTKNPSGYEMKDTTTGERFGSYCIGNLKDAAEGKANPTAPAPLTDDDRATALRCLRSDFDYSLKAARAATEAGDKGPARYSASLCRKAIAKAKSLSA